MGQVGRLPTVREGASRSSAGCLRVNHSGWNSWRRLVCVLVFALATFLKKTMHDSLQKNLTLVSLTVGRRLPRPASLFLVLFVKVSCDNRRFSQQSIHNPKIGNAADLILTLNFGTISPHFGTVSLHFGTVEGLQGFFSTFWDTPKNAERLFSTLWDSVSTIRDNVSTFWDGLYRFF